MGELTRCSREMLTQGSQIRSDTIQRVFADTLPDDAEEPAPDGGGHGGRGRRVSEQPVGRRKTHTHKFL